MDAITLLTQLRANGWRLRCDGDKVIATPCGPVDNALPALIAMHKPELLRLLRVEAYRAAQLKAHDDIAKAWTPHDEPRPTLGVIAAEAEYDRTAAAVEDDLETALEALDAWRRAWLKSLTRR